MSALLEQANPFGNLVATVDDDGGSVYLYVHHARYRAWGFRPLWLANRPHQGPPAKGEAPRLDPRRTDHPEGHPGFAAADLELVWTPAGDGLFLSHRSELLAHLPGVDETLGSPGFSRHALSKERYAWPLDSGPVDLRAQLNDARRFWSESQGIAAWERARDRMLQAGAKTYGEHAAYFSVDEHAWPPLGVARYECGGHQVVTTVGMSLPRAPAPTDRGASHLEVAFAVQGGQPAADGGWCVQTAAWLGRYPWNWYTPLEEGALLMVPSGTASWFAPNRSAVLLLEDLRPWRSEPVAAMAPPDGVRLLWALVLTHDEVRSIELRGQDAFRERFVASRSSLVFEP